MKHLADPGRHRAQPVGRRRAEPPGKRRADVRPRYGRIAVFVASGTVTGVAVLGGFGVLPSPDDASAASASITPTAAEGKPRDKAPDRSAQRPALRKAARSEAVQPQPSTTRSVTPDPPALPADSGTGRRIVFSESEQRVWLVSDSGEVVRTYLVSGSATDNLDPGTYDVFSRSRYAVGIDDSGTMEYFVRFTHGDEGAAIGFHTIPVDEGERVQTVAQLGTPLSHGCIRQRTSDAIALWDFAPIGTTVVVV